MTVLLDANVVIALVVSGHVHHGAASSWFSGHRAQFATTPITQGALLRFLLRTGTSNVTAVEVLRLLLNHPEHQFWPDDLSYGDMNLTGVAGHGAVTDRYLLTLAEHRGAALVTFDRGLGAASDRVLLLPGH